MILNTNKNNGVRFSYTIFDESETLPGVLKNPNQLREAYIYEHLSHLDRCTLNKFLNSSEAKAMVEAGTITYDTLDRLQRVACGKDKTMKTAICHIAKENDDDLWEELVKARAEERRIMNALIEKYRAAAQPVAYKAYNEIIESCIPSEYR